MSGVGMFTLSSAFASACYVLRIYPTVWQLSSPVKMYEFQKLVTPVLGLGQRVLDLGCGSGRATQLLARRGPHVVGVDPSGRAIRNARLELKRSVVRTRVEYLCGTVESLNLPASGFDYVFSFCVLEHIPNLEEVLEELHRIVKPGGEVHVTVDALNNIHDQAVLDRHRELFSVHRYFRTETLAKLFSRGGFEVFHQQYFLAGDCARKEILDSINESHRVWSRHAKRKGYARLASEEEKLGNPRNGLMILARARRL